MSKPKRTRPKSEKKRAYPCLMADVTAPEAMGDAGIAWKRLNELRQAPEKIVRGPSLDKKMKRWMS